VARWRAGLAALGIAAFLVLGSAQALATPAWLALVLSAIALAWRGELDLQRGFSAVELAALAGLGVLLISLWRDPAAARALPLAVPPIAAVLLWTLLTRVPPRRGDEAWLAGGFVAAALVQAALVAIAARAAPDAEAASWTVSAATPWLVEPNDIAWFGMLLPWLAAAAGRQERAAALGAGGAFALACLLVHSRSAALTGMTGLLVYAGLRRGFFGSPRRVAAALGALVVVGVALLPLLLRVPSFLARLQLWHAGWQVFLEHPWLGAGWHRFAAAAQPWLLALPARADPRVAPWPHNLLVEIAAETGLVGLAAAAAFVLALVRAASARARQGGDRVHFAALSGLAAFAVCAAVEASLLRLWVWCTGTVLVALALRPAAPPDPLPRRIPS
jgi:hypothetical protein